MRTSTFQREVSMKRLFFAAAFVIAALVSGGCSSFGFGGQQRPQALAEQPEWKPTADLHGLRILRIEKEIQMLEDKMRRVEAMTAECQTCRCREDESDRDRTLRELGELKKKLDKICETLKSAK